MKKLNKLESLKDLTLLDFILWFIGYSFGIGIGLLFFPLIGLFGLSIFFTKDPRR